MGLPCLTRFSRIIELSAYRVFCQLLQYVKFRGLMLFTVKDNRH